MARLQAFVRSNLVLVLLLLTAGGFVMLLAELLLVNHTDGIQFVAVVASAVGLALALLGLLARRGLRLALAAAFLALSITGLIGTYEHLEEGSEGGEAWRAAPVAVRSGYQTIANRLDEDDGERGEGGERGETGERGEGTPPPLAPLSLAGLSMLGAVSLAAKPD